MALSRIATVVGGLLLSRGGRRFAGRNAGKLALATLAWELWRQHKGKGAPPTHASKPRTSHPRGRWSGRRV